MNIFNYNKKMTKKTQITVMLIFFGILASAQVKIGDNATNIGTSSILELESSDKGLLLPRVALTSTTLSAPLAAHVSGMTVYNTATTGDVVPGIYSSNGTSWLAVAAQDASTIASGIINTSTQTLGAGAKTFTSDLTVNGITVGKGAGTGSYNTAMGSNALISNTTGGYNNAIGRGALTSNISGTNNIALGANALLSNTTGNSNIAIGANALNGTTTGKKNIAIGFNNMNAFNSGSNNTSLGSEITFSTGISNSIAIGYGVSILASNTIQMGNSTITNANIQVAWTVTSDRRWKSDIKTSDLGLDFINKLRPVSYLRKNDETKKIEYGFIAQELEETLNKIGISSAGILSKDSEGMYGVRYNDFIAPMVKAIQEQQTQIDELKSLVKQLLTKK